MLKEIKGTRDRLSRSWFFLLLSLAFIVLNTPFLAVSGHGLIIFLFILYLAVMAGFIERSFTPVLHLFFKGVSNNKLLFVFMIWYAMGYFLNSFYASGLDDWRLMMSPLLILLGMCFSFAFMNDNNCHRVFIIIFAIISGIQAIFSVNVLINSPDIARRMYVLTTGAWIYGNQVFYAIYVIVIPVLIYQVIKETGILKLALFISCCLILVESIISSFGTPMGLLLVGVTTISFLALILLFRNRYKFRTLLILGTIVALAVLGYINTYSNPLFASAYGRVITALNDPSSGGYTPESGGMSRVLIAQISIKSFLSAPIFGVGGPALLNPLSGGHSSFFDALGVYGLLGGGGALCGGIAIIFGKVAIQFWRRRNWKYLLALTTVILLVVVGIVNPYWQPSLPLVFIIVYPYLRGNREKVEGHMKIVLRQELI